jgi:zinc-ribbon domain
MICPACQSRVPDGSRFCPACGSALSLSTMPTVTITPSPPLQTPGEQSPLKKSSPKATRFPSSDSLDEARFVPETTMNREKDWRRLETATTD